MGVVIESDVWEPKPFYYLLLLFACFSSIFLFPHFTNYGRTNSSSVLDAGPSAPFLRFQRSFLLIYSLASLFCRSSLVINLPVINGLEIVSGEYAYNSDGIGREQIAICLSVGAAASLIIGSLLGMLSDMIGPRKACMMFCLLHLFVGALKSMTKSPSIWITDICLSLASSVLSFSFETWMVAEHEKQGYRQDLLTDTFWLMSFFGSAALIGSQMVINILVKDLEKGIFVPSAPAALLAFLSIIYIRKEWTSYQHSSSLSAYMNLFYQHVIQDKRIWLLAFSQACIHFSTSVFWILWAPTIVADGREVHLSLLYPCFLGSIMLGSTLIPWFFNGASPIRNEDCLTAAFAVAGVCFSVVACDYQEIGVLVTLFCIFNTCVGLIFPSLARLRTLYVPNELRGGMIALSLVPSNAAISFIVFQGGYHRNVNNSTIIGLSGFSLFLSAACIHALKRWRKRTRQNWHKI